MALCGFQHVTIVGVGLLGGSAGLAMKAADPGIRVAGVGRRAEALADAARVGAVDSIHMEPAEAAADADLVILCTPVRAFAPVLRQIAPALRDGTVVTDVGSTKATAVAEAEAILGPGRFIGSHPMAGSELKGVLHSRADLFEGATCIVTPTERSSPELVQRMEGFWQALRMRTVRMTPADHDRALAGVSHLPHAVAVVLMMLPRAEDLDVAATGFRDMTRLAGGDPEMWRDIFLTNAPAVLESLDTLDDLLEEFRRLVQQGDGAKLQAWLAAARDRRAATVARAMDERRIALE